MNTKGTAGSNTIIITKLTKIFFHPRLETVLRMHFNSYGPTRSWTLLPQLSKILVVYSDSKSAQLAKEEMDELLFDKVEIRELVSSLLDPLSPDTQRLLNGISSTLIKVYFGPHMPPPATSKLVKEEDEEDTENLEQVVKQDLLKPPNLDKNFLISPPGSPPVGWEQVEEDAPNQKDLADDLCQRLRFLSVDNDNNEEPIQSCISDNTQVNEILLVPAALHIPALKIHQVHSTFDPTSSSNPGMDIHLVKATIESLRSFPNKISPTPMPQIS